VDKRLNASEVGGLFNSCKSLKESYGPQLRDVDERLSVIKEEIRQVDEKLKSVDDEAEGETYYRKGE
jgi:hypothetical protein